MKDSTAYLITDILKDVASVGTGRKLKSLNIPIASKTGTNATDTNNLDAWNVSYTTEHTFLCWVGNIDGEDGSMNKNISGATMPTLLVKEACNNLYANHTPKDFTKPQSVKRVALDKKSFSAHTLKLAPPTAPEEDKVYELFSRSTQIPSLENNFQNNVSG